MKVFISGSYSIAPYCESGQLPERVLMEIDKHLDANDTIFVGDCAGTDALVQQYLESIHYRNVTVYVSGVQGQTRINAGKWEEKHFHPSAKSGFGFYLEKDLQMAEDADASLAIWDGTSKGTYINMVCLVAQGKPCHVYLLKEQTWISVGSLNELETYAGPPSRQTNLKFHAWDVAKECQNDAMTWETLKRRMRDLAGKMREWSSDRQIIESFIADLPTWLAHASALTQILLSEIAHFYDVSVEELLRPLSFENPARMLHARRAAIYLLRTFYDYSFMELLALFNTDYHIVLCIVEKMEESLETDAEWKAEIDALKKRLMTAKQMSFGNIEWLVLTQEGEKALLLTKDCIEERPFHKVLEPITWENCSLRSYLNGPWYEATFREEEKTKILTTKEDDADSRECGASGEYDSEDKVFLLSINEAEQYFYYDHDRIAEFNGESHEWWLRSPDNAGCVAVVRRDGRIYSVGWEVDSACGGIRPAIWIKLES